MPAINLNVALAVVFGAFVLYFAGKTFSGPGRLLLRTGISAVTGVMIISIFNLAAGFFNLTVGLNAVTALAVGFLGLPGLVMLVLLQKILG